MVAYELTSRGLTETTATAKGPSADTTVSSGTSSTLSLSYSTLNGIKKIVDVVGLVSVGGLPDGVVLEGITLSTDSVTLKVRNTTGADATVTANSVTVTVRVLGY